MLSPDVRFEGFTATDHKRFLSLFRPARASGEKGDAERPRGGIVLLRDERGPRKLLHTKVGRLRLEDVREDWPLTAEELARRHDASWAFIVEMGALERIMDRFGTQCRRGDDLTVQTLLLLSVARAELLAGALELWPSRLAGVPLPTPAVVRRTLDAVCPPGQTMLLGLFEAGELWTSVAVRRSPIGGFDLIQGPDELRAEMGLLAGDWRRDFRHLVRAVEHRVGPLSLGCFSETSIFRRLEVDPTPGAWARAVAVRDVILSPVPVALAVPLGIDAGRAAFSAVRWAAEQIDPLGVLAPTLNVLKEAALKEASARGITAAGSMEFEPLEVLRRLLSREA